MIKLLEKLETREAPPKYLDFVLQKSVDDLKKEGNSRLDYTAIEKYFDYVKKARDPLKAVYTLMHIAKMKDTAVYLLFVLKKVGEGAVNFDTLDENAREDCNFIKNELTKNFMLSGEPGEEPELRIPDFSSSGLSEVIKENKFKVKTEEDESITEEFSETEMYTDDEEQEEVEMKFGEEEFELIKSEDSEDDALEMIGKENNDDSEGDSEEDEYPEAEIGSEIETTAEEVMREEELDEDEKELKAEIEENSGSEMPEEIIDEIINEEELSDGFPEGFIEEEVPLENPEEEMLIEEGEIIDEGAEETIQEEAAGELENEEPIDEILEEIPGEEALNDVPQSNPELEIENKDESEILEEVPPGIDELPVEKEHIEQEEEMSEETVNELYKEYESSLFEINGLLNEYFLDIESVPEGAASPDGEHVLFGKISELCFDMKERSNKMSFSIISNIYDNIGEIFTQYVKTNSRPVAGEEEKFKNGIKVVEGLIKGDDLPEADDVIASLENLRKSFEDLETKTEEDTEPSREEEYKTEYKEDTETINKLREKYSNAERRDSFKQLKAQILGLEETFQSLDNIEGDYQNYEGLRTLSATFANLKEIIRRANILELRNVAKLSEASYVFIKFIQNYRMNPFDEDIREIFKYIIYNFKSAALDKPNEDLDRFISYLNDPVKIFTQKNKKQK